MNAEQNVDQTEGTEGTAAEGAATLAKANFRIAVIQYTEGAEGAQAAFAHYDNWLRLPKGAGAAALVKAAQTYIESVLADGKNAGAYVCAIVDTAAEFYFTVAYDKMADLLVDHALIKNSDTQCAECGRAIGHAAHCSRRAVKMAQSAQLGIGAAVKVRARPSAQPAQPAQPDTAAAAAAEGTEGAAAAAEGAQPKPSRSQNAAAARAAAEGAPA